MKIDPSISLYEFDDAYRSHKNVVLCGVDEAGRGPLAGPVCAAAVILDPENPISGLNDSKKLSEKKREELFPEIREKALAYGIAFSSHITIDRKNILAATLEAMSEAVQSLSITPTLVLIDGDRPPKVEESVQVKTIIRGDRLSASIAAASILAKVTRDRFMLQMDKEYPGYFFAQHKGYGTELHYDALRKLGASPIHRKTFLKNFDPTKPSRKEIGEWGEEYVEKILKEQGFTILARNYKVLKGELDIVAQKKGLLIVGEVKCYRKGTSYQPRSAVTLSKQKKIRWATEAFLEEYPIEATIRFDVFEIIVNDEKGLKAESFVWIKDAFASPSEEG